MGGPEASEILWVPCDAAAEVAAVRPYHPAPFNPGRSHGLPVRGAAARYRRSLGALVFSTLFAGLGSCAVGPNFVSPPAPNVERYTAESITAVGTKKQGMRIALGTDVPERWWQVFRNKNLNKLIHSAIERNPTLKAAEEGVKVAFHTAEAQKGAFLPGATFNTSASRNKQATTSFDISPVGSAPVYNFYVGQFLYNWTPDIWGSNRRAVEASEAQTDLQRYQLEGAYLTLTSGVAGAAVQEAALRAQIAAIKRIIEDERKLLDILRRQHAAGGVALTDVLAQETALAQALQLLPPLEKQLAQQRDLLTTLAGEYATHEIPETFQLSEIRLPDKLPISLPSQLVRQRPDVRAAEANMHATSALVGVAIAAQLPNVTLSANQGLSGFFVSQLFGPGASFYTIMASATQPLFDGFALRNKEKAAEAALKQAEQQYKATVLGAFLNVADTLQALKADAKAVDAATYAEEVAKKNLDIIKKELQVGSVSITSVINAEQAYLQAVVTRVQAEGSRYSDVVALFLVLGGGWSDQALKDLPPTTLQAPTREQVEQIRGPVNASWFPALPGH